MRIYIYGSDCDYKSIRNLLNKLRVKYSIHCPECNSFLIENFNVYLLEHSIFKDTLYFMGYHFEEWGDDKTSIDIVPRLKWENPSSCSMWTHDFDEDIYGLTFLG